MNIMEERWETRATGRGADGSAVCKTPDAAAEAEKALPVPTEKDGALEAAGAGEGADTLGQSAAAIIPEAYAPEREECPLCSGGEYMHAHEALIASVNDSMPDEEMLYDLAELYKIFGDSTRIKILYVLFEAEMCVCDLAQLLGMTQSAISHQLRVLKASKLVKFRRDGKTVFYSLADNHVRTIINMGMEHLCE